MLEGFHPKRYSVIEEKNKREIVMLVGSGCVWKRCRFCDYHLDYDPDPKLCFQVNSETLKKVRGIYGKLEVINSGSFTELDSQTMEEIQRVAFEKNINEIHFESHYLYRKRIPLYKSQFLQKGIKLKIKCGVETFDESLREGYLHKGMKGCSIEELKAVFDEICLLFGIKGQTVASMKRDIEIGLNHFERICINIMKENTTEVKPDSKVIQEFTDMIYPEIKDNDRVDILMDNTDFGVGGKSDDE